MSVDRRRRPRRRRFAMEHLEPRLPLAPMVSDVEGVFRQDASVTIVGAGFGTKSQAAPFIYDDVENGFSQKWGAGNTNDLRPAAMSDGPNSALSGYLNFTSADHYGFLRGPSDH